MELRTEPLPDSPTWQAALDRYGLLFGGAGNPHLTANNLATFVRDATARIAGALDDQERLVTGLDTLGGVLDIDPTAPRRALAAASRGLLRQLSQSAQDRVAFVSTLARHRLPGTDLEAGRSIATAGAVAAAVAATNWRRFDIVTQAARSPDPRGDEARAILDDLAAAAADHEHNKPLAGAIAAADDQRQRWLERWQRSAPEPRPESQPEPGPGPEVPTPPAQHDPSTSRPPVANATISATGAALPPDLEDRMSPASAMGPPEPDFCHGHGTTSCQSWDRPGVS